MILLDVRFHLVEITTLHGETNATDVRLLVVMMAV